MIPAQWPGVSGSGSGVRRCPWRVRIWGGMLLLPQPRLVVAPQTRSARRRSGSHPPRWLDGRRRTAVDSDTLTSVALACLRVLVGRVRREWKAAMVPQMWMTILLPRRLWFRPPRPDPCPSEAVCFSRIGPSVVVPLLSWPSPSQPETEDDWPGSVLGW